MACCSPNNQGGVTIEIKENVYKGAYEKGVGAFLGFICHLFLFYIGFTSIFERSFADKELLAYFKERYEAEK